MIAIIDIGYFPSINTVLLVVVIGICLLIERKLSYMVPLRVFTLLDDIERLRSQQEVTLESLNEIRERVEQTVQAFEGLTKKG